MADVKWMPLVCVGVTSFYGLAKLGFNYKLQIALNKTKIEESRLVFNHKSLVLALEQDRLIKEEAHRAKLLVWNL